jgi:hypothetical protein
MAIRKKKKRDTTIVDVMEQTGFVYVMRFGDIYKIGQTYDVKNRLKQLQDMNPFCQVLKQIELTGYTVAEKRLHEFFETKRIAGEWFKLTETDLEKILPYLRRPGLKHRIVSVIEHGERAYINTPEERIVMLEGLNRALTQENKSLRYKIQNQQYDRATKNRAEEGRRHQSSSTSGSSSHLVSRDA